MTQVKMGALYLNNIAQINPQNPTNYGDIPKYDGASGIYYVTPPEKMSHDTKKWNLVAKQ